MQNREEKLWNRSLLKTHTYSLFWTKKKKKITNVPLLHWRQNIMFANKNLALQRQCPRLTKIPFHKTLWQ